MPLIHVSISLFPPVARAVIKHQVHSLSYTKRVVCFQPFLHYCYSYSFLINIICASNEQSSTLSETNSDTLTLLIKRVFIKRPCWLYRGGLADKVFFFFPRKTLDDRFSRFYYLNFKCATDFFSDVSSLVITEMMFAPQLDSDSSQFSRRNWLVSFRLYTGGFSIAYFGNLFTAGFVLFDFCHNAR